MPDEVESPWNTQQASSDLATTLISRSRREEDIILELIENKPWYLQIWAILELKMVRDIVDPAELKENIKANLSTVAIIGALFGGTNTASFMAADGVNEEKQTQIGQFIGALRFLAAALGFGAAVYSAVIMTMTNSIPKVIIFILYRQ